MAGGRGTWRARSAAAHKPQGANPSAGRRGAELTAPASSDSDEIKSVEARPLIVCFRSAGRRTRLRASRPPSRTRRSLLACSSWLDCWIVPPNRLDLRRVEPRARLRVNNHSNQNRLHDGAPSLNREIGPNFTQVAGHMGHDLPSPLAVDPVPGVFHAALNLGAVALVGGLGDELLSHLVFQPVEQPLIPRQLFIQDCHGVVFLFGSQAIPQVTFDGSEDRLLYQPLQRVSLAADLEAPTRLGVRQTGVDADAANPADSQHLAAEPAVRDARQEMPWYAATKVLITGRVLKNGLDRFPFLKRDDGLPIALDQLAAVFAHPH